MSLNQEFSEGNYVPTGISGDFQVGHESSNEESRRALLAQQAVFDEMVDRHSAGLTTPDEDRYIAERFAREVAQGYN